MSEAEITLERVKRYVTTMILHHEQNARNWALSGDERGEAIEQSKKKVLELVLLKLND